VCGVRITSAGSCEANVHFHTKISRRNRHVSPPMVTSTRINIRDFGTASHEPRTEHVQKIKRNYISDAQLNATGCPWFPWGTKNIQSKSRSSHVKNHNNPWIYPLNITGCPHGVWKNIEYHWLFTRVQALHDHVYAVHHGLTRHASLNSWLM